MDINIHKIRNGYITKILSSKYDDDIESFSKTPEEAVEIALRETKKILNRWLADLKKKRKKK